MTLVSIGGFIIDQTLLIVLGILTIAVIAIAIIAVWLFFTRNSGTPLKIENLIHIPVSPESNIPTPGRLLNIGGRTDDELSWEDPDWEDPESHQPFQAHADIRGKSPIQYHDLDGNLNETWLAIDKGTIEIVGIQDIVAKAETRKDYLAADYRKVGGYLARQGMGALGALGRLLTWENLPFVISIVIGSLVTGVLIGYFALPPRYLPTPTTPVVTH